MKVLVSAFACNPYRGSEDGVGWGWIRAIATRHQVHVVTADFQREHVERWRNENPTVTDDVRFHYVESRWFHYRPTGAWTFIESTLLKPIMNLAYAQWLRDAGRLAATVDAKYDLDLVHLVTYVGYRFPGRYDRLGKPFVWGPIGGLENTPWRFLPSLGLGGCLYYAARNLVNSVQRRWLPSPRRAFGYAVGGAIAATQGIQSEIKRHYGADSEVISEIGLASALVERPAERAKDDCLRVVWSGEHLPGKALPFLLHALALLDADRERALDWRLTVLGDGRSGGRWQTLAKSLGLHDRVQWTGWIEREAALERMRASHLLVITSLKDLTSTVLLEGLSQGLPVVCPDHCGFSSVVTEACGIKVPLHSPRQFRAALAAAIAEIACDEGRRRTLAAAAVQRARDFSWAGKAERIDRVYQRVAHLGTTSRDSAPLSSSVGTEDA